MLLTVGVHEEVGRTNFLALYTICGLGSSMTTLAYHVLRNNLLFVSVGASGAIFGIMSLYFTLRSE
jgi:membrane associated rhomboid family serine protease